MSQSTAEVGASWSKGDLCLDVFCDSSEQVFHMCSVKYESVLHVDLYCGLEIKNIGSSSRLDLGVLNKGKHPVQFETFGC